MLSSATDRIIILIDMDCFYCQVEEGLNPQLKGKPIAVVQYNQWQGGGLIAVNYFARDQGVTRHMRGAEAKEKCPDIQLVSVPTKRGKADTSRYRNAGKRVAEVLLKFTSLLERASVDEAYLDVTDKVDEQINTASARLTVDELKNTHIVGFDSVHHFLEEVYDTELSNDVNLRLAIGATMAEEIRVAVFEKTGYRCSAGIAHNKILAKLVCGLHKPNQQTILPQEGLPELYAKMPVRKLQSMGGKFGTNVTDSLKIEFMSELVKFSERELRQHFEEKTSQWLYQLARGIEHTPVTVRLRSQSISCCKKFPGPSALTSMTDLRPWLESLVADLHERLAEDRAEYGRRARHLVVNASYIAPDVLKIKIKPGRGDELTQSRSVQMVADWDTGDGTRTIDDVLAILKKSGVLPSDIKDEESAEFSIRFLGLSAGKFEETKNQANISSFLTTKSLDNSNSIKKNAVLEESAAKSENETFKIDKTDKGCAFVRGSSTVFNDSTLNQKSCSKIIKGNSKKIQIKHCAASSFFINYFQNMEPESSNCSKDVSTISRTSDTNVDTIISQELSTINNTVNLESSKSICSECNKPIGLEDLQSHSDYHYAIKLVREESHIYNKTMPTQNATTINLNNIESTKKKAMKRKSSETANYKSVDSFFVGKKDKMDTSDMRECEECGKSIADIDLDTHKDFHVAKKLFSDINGTTKTECKINVGRISIKSKKSKQKCDTRSVSTYFKAD